MAAAAALQTGGEVLLLSQRLRTGSRKQLQLPAGQAFYFPGTQLSRSSQSKWAKEESAVTSRKEKRRSFQIRAGAAPPPGAETMKVWSNPTGQPLREVVKGQVWAAERPFLWYGIDVGGRMAVVRLSDGSLWVHSPVPLVPGLKEEIDKLGELRYVVSPNYEHCGFAQQWLDAYPNAIAYACPGLKEKRLDIRYSVTVGESDVPPEEWKEEFELAWLDCEHNPFNRQPFFNEVVFHHKPSKTFFVSDLFWNYPSKETPLTTWLWKQGMDRVYLPFYKQFMLYRKDRFYMQLQRINGWDWDTLVPCHGDVVKSQAKQALAEHLNLN